MYIYNVTVNIDESAESEFVLWMQQEHIPEMLNTRKFSDAKMSRIQVEEEMGGVSYSIQYTTESKAMLDRYYEENASHIRMKMEDKFKGKYVAFRTELDVILYFKVNDSK